MKSWMKKILVVLSVAMLIPVTAAMAFYGQTVTGTVAFDAKFNESVTTGFPTAVSVTQEISQNDNYPTAGTASGQCDTLFAKQYTLSGTTTTIDLTSLTDPAGNSITFARVREFIVQNTATTAGYDVKVEAGASNGWGPLPPSTNPLYCRYGSVVRVSDKLSTGSGNGNVVTSTSKTVTFDPGSNTVTINVLIVGGSAA